ncbi:MAG: hypothetical protein ACJ74Y_07505 [Bryobacteraceae bacterium]
MMERTVKGLLVIVAAGTASIACLMLPTAQAFVAALPEPQVDGVPYSGFKEIVSASHAQLGRIAVDVACTYLNRFNTAQPANVSDPALKTKAD